MANRQFVRSALILLLAALTVTMGCSGLRRAPAVPADLTDVAAVPGMPRSIRTFGARLNPEFRQELDAALQREIASLAATGHNGPLPPAELLAISGGGQNGAFAAGLLCGWTATGARPRFKVVTGISTGALIAPFALLGPEHDETLRHFYTQIDTDDVLSPRGMLAAVSDDALADNQPLWRLLESVVDQKLVDALAAEHEKGRLLVLGTTNLDARRAVLWNVTKIAATRDPRALELIRSIMIASAAIPAAFPPVFVEVQAEGRTYAEMHVDGGAMMQLFLYPPSLSLRADPPGGVQRERRAFIIRNARLDPEWAQTERQTLKIAARAIDALLATQGVGDLYRTYLNTQRDGIDFNLAFIPASFQRQPREVFDRPYMNELFDVGFNLARAGYPWQKTPPAFEDSPPQ